MFTMLQNTKPTAGARISENEKQRIQHLVDRGLFINESDFVRTAIRELLEKFMTIDEATRRTEK